VNPMKLMKQMQQAQERLMQELGGLSVEAAAGGGMVKVTMDGLKTVRSVVIDPEVVSKDDVAMLQDLIVAAVNEASRKVDAAAQEKTAAMAGAMPKIPGLF
jgi:DNA-binding YbaB/EbfC family protein